MATRPISRFPILDSEPSRPSTGGDVPCGLGLSRRDAIRRIGGWTIYAGILGAAATLEACGSPAGPKSSSACDCSTVSGTATGLHKTDVPVNGVAYNSADGVFVCHDSNGFYAVDAICPHQGCNMGQMGSFGFHGADLGYGFHCNCHGSVFDSNGDRTAGPASNLNHFKLSIDGSNALFLDTGTTLSDRTCRCS